MNHVQPVYVTYINAKGLCDHDILLLNESDPQAHFDFDSGPPTQSEDLMEEKNLSVGLSGRLSGRRGHLSHTQTPLSGGYGGDIDLFDLREKIQQKGGSLISHRLIDVS